MLENKGAHVEEHARGKISSTMSVVSAETAGTAASIQSSSTWSSIFRAYGWTIQKDEKASFGDAVSCSGVINEEELCGIGGHTEDTQLETIDFAPSILDGNTKVPAWLAQDSLPAFFPSRVGHHPDEKSEKAKALIAVIEEGMREDEMKIRDQMETEIEMGSEDELESEDETKSEVFEKRLSQDPEVLIWACTKTL